MMLTIDLFYIPTTISLVVVATIIGTSIWLNLPATRGQDRREIPVPENPPSTSRPTRNSPRPSRVPWHPRGGHTVTTVAPRPAWTLLTNHGHVLLAVAGVPDARVADIAAAVGITTRATLTILHDLAEAALVRRTKIGRRTHYTVNPDQHFRHPTLAEHGIGELLALIAGTRVPT